MDFHFGWVRSKIHVQSKEIISEFRSCIACNERKAERIASEDAFCFQLPNQHIQSIATYGLIRY